MIKEIKTEYEFRYEENEAKDGNWKPTKAALISVSDKYGMKGDITVKSNTHKHDIKEDLSVIAASDSYAHDAIEVDTFGKAINEVKEIDSCDGYLIEGRTQGPETDEIFTKNKSKILLGISLLEGGDTDSAPLSTTENSLCYTLRIA